MDAGRIIHTFVIAAMLCSVTAQQTVASGHAQRSNVSPEIGSDRRVTFRLTAPDASRVSVTYASSTSQLVTGAGTTLAMEKTDAGWIAVTAPLAPDIYAYRFTIDGKTRNDPASARFIEELAGDRTSAFAVPGALWTTTGAPAGDVTRHRYESAAIGGTESYCVYTPPAYDPRGSRAYPVLYLLHGMADNEYTWVTSGGVNVTLDNLIAQGTATPMVVVMPLGYGGSGAALTELAPFERALLEEIIPRVEAAYRVSRTRDGRAIAGVSMGGSQAIAIGLRHADTFAWLGSLSGAFGLDAPSAPAGPLLPDRFRSIYLGWGAADSLAPANRALAADLRRRGAVVTTEEVPAAGHVWPLWRKMLADLLPRLFTARQSST